MENFIRVRRIPYNKLLTTMAEAREHLWHSYCDEGCGRPEFDQRFDRLLLDALLEERADER